MNENLSIAIEKLNAEALSDGRWAHYAPETNTTYAVTVADLERLGAMLAAGVEDAYSLWCSETEMDALHHGR